FEPPEIKSLAPLPKATPSSSRFAERITRALKYTHARAGRAGTYHVFSEVVPMSRDEMIQKLAQMGVSMDALKDCPDAALAEWLRMGESMMAEKETPEEATAAPAAVEPAPVEMEQHEEEAGAEHVEPVAPVEEEPDYDMTPKFAEPADEDQFG